MESEAGYTPDSIPVELESNAMESEAGYTPDFNHVYLKTFLSGCSNDAAEAGGRTHRGAGNAQIKMER